jgi:hypothetical protein
VRARPAKENVRKVGGRESIYTCGLLPKRRPVHASGQKSASRWGLARTPLLSPEASTDPFSTAPSRPSSSSPSPAQHPLAGGHSPRRPVDGAAALPRVPARACACLRVRVAVCLSATASLSQQAAPGALAVQRCSDDDDRSRSCSCPRAPSAGPPIATASWPCSLHHHPALPEPTRRRRRPRLSCHRPPRAHRQCGHGDGRDARRHGATAAAAGMRPEFACVCLCARRRRQRLCALLAALRSSPATRMTHTSHASIKQRQTQRLRSPSPRQRPPVPSRRCCFFVYRSPMAVAVASRPAPPHAVVRRGPLTFFLRCARLRLFFGLTPSTFSQPSPGAFD